MRPIRPTPSSPIEARMTAGLAPARPALSGRFLASARAAARLAPRPVPAVSRHLVLEYRPGWQSIEYLSSLVRLVIDIDPQIRPFVLSSTISNSVSRRDAARLPTLVVSPAPLKRFQPLRGKVYQGCTIPKIEQLRRLHAAG